VETQFTPEAAFAIVDAEYNRALAQRFGSADSPAIPSSGQAVTRR
jgi:hypothetical protein